LPNLAANLVKSCLRIRPNDNVTIFFYPHSTTLAEDIATECFRIGADVNLSAYTDRFYEAYMRLLPEDNLRRPSVFCRGLTELSTAEFWLGGAYDPAVYRRVSPEKMAAADAGEAAAHFPVARERKVRSLFVAMGLVTRPRAKAYGFSFPRWHKMMLDASSVRAEKLDSDGRAVAGRLGNGGRVRITADNGTDLELSLGGRRALVFDGVVDEADIAAGALDAAIPAGNVAVAPREDSAEGTVVFDVPEAWAGRTIRNLRWEFAKGRVISWSGDKNADVLRKQWELGTGEKDRIGSLSIGLNPKAEFGLLQNPIVRGAVTVAIGANEDLGGANKIGFYHGASVRDATVEVDGKPIVKAGRLVAS
jgi:aminopeptidase